MANADDPQIFSNKEEIIGDDHENKHTQKFFCSIVYMYGKSNDLEEDKGTCTLHRQVHTFFKS